MLYFLCTMYIITRGIDVLYTAVHVVLGVLFRLVSNFRDSDTFRIRKAGCSFPIAIAPKLLQYGSCNFVGVLNTTYWPICAFNIGQNKIFVVFVGMGAGPVETGRSPYGAWNGIGGISASTIVWVLGVVGAASHTP